jgi:hypothetical protein
MIYVEIRNSGMVFRANTSMGCQARQEGDVLEREIHTGNLTNPFFS